MKAVNFTSGNNLTDRQLVEKALRGDTQAFSTIIKNSEGLVARIVCKMINNEEDCKDLVQDIYLKAFKNLSGFKFRSKLLTWIGNIAYNTCVNYLEKKKLLLSGFFDTEAEKAYGENETEISMTQKELLFILAKGIEQLSPVYKTLIVLYHQEDLSYQEMAQITGLPEGTVKNYLFRARKILKENILARYKKEEL